MMDTTQERVTEKEKTAEKGHKGHTLAARLGMRRLPSRPGARQAKIRERAKEKTKRKGETGGTRAQRVSDCDACRGGPARLGAR